MVSLLSVDHKTRVPQITLVIWKLAFVRQRGQNVCTTASMFSALFVKNFAANTHFGNWFFFDNTTFLPSHSKRDKLSHLRVRSSIRGHHRVFPPHVEEKQTLALLVADYYREQPCLSRRER